MRNRKSKLPNWLDLTLSFQVQFFQPYLQHSTFHLLLSQSADCQNPWENCEILSLFSKIWLFHSTMCWIHFWSSILFFFSMFLQLAIFIFYFNCFFHEFFLRHQHKCVMCTEKTPGYAWVFLGTLDANLQIFQNKLFSTSA